MWQTFILAVACLAVAEKQQPLGHNDVVSKSPFDNTFRKLVAKTLEEWHVPGVAVAVLDGDDTWTEGFGIASFPDTPVTPQTLFYTASTTKAFVATELSLLIGSGNYTELSPAPGDNHKRPLDWTTPLSSILRDDFVLSDAWATTHLTIEDALSHRTGLAAHDLTRSRRYGLDPTSLGRNATVRDVTRSLRHLPLTTSPRTAYRYCNLMFLALSHAVETLTGGRWLGHVLRDALWQPLQMTATFLSLDDARAAVADPEARLQLAQGYYYDAVDKDYVAVPHMPLEEVSGAGGIISTVSDYAKWVRCWLDGPLSSTPSKTACGAIPLTKAGLDAILAPKIFTAHTAASSAPYDAPEAYASAWLTTSYKGHRFWAHSGGSNAFGAEVFFFPDDRFGIVVFGNTATTSNSAEYVLLWHLIDEHFGIAAADRYDWSTRFHKSAAAKASKFDTALEQLFPTVTSSPSVPPSLPLEAYLGTYHHPAYQNITLQLVDPKTHRQRAGSQYHVVFTADRPDHTWPTVCEFVHVSGEHWLLFTDMLYERSGNFMGYGRATFQVGAAAQPDSLVVEFVSASDDVVEGVIQFDRLDES